jgi:hypothetical protein
MAGFFDDVFDNKILFEKEELLKSFNDKVNEEQKLSEEDMSDPTLETMMKSFRENPERAFTEKESKVLKEKLKQLKQKSRVLIETIKDRKDSLDRSIRESNNSFTLDISKSTRLKKCATNTFGGIKNEITYNDYMTLVELKRVIELSETLDIVEGIAEDGGI